MIIIGAKGFAKQLVEILFQIKAGKELFFFDDVSEEVYDTMFGIKIVRNLEEVSKIFESLSTEFCLGIGDPLLRKSLCLKFEKIGGELSSVISPYARISTFVKSIGKGSNILTGAVIENDAIIGKASLINVNAVIHHDAEIGDFCEVSPGAKVLGNAHLGDGCIVGANAVILPNVTIGDNVIVGAGAVVTKDAGSNVTLIGVPAKQVKI